LGVPHGGNHRKTITGVRHVQVRDKHIEALGSNKFQGFRYVAGRDYLKSFSFKRRTHHGANSLIIIHQ
jgi:hypothetical protein